MEAVAASLPAYLPVLLDFWRIFGAVHRIVVTIQLLTTSYEHARPETSSSLPLSIDLFNICLELASDNTKRDAFKEEVSAIVIRCDAVTEWSNTSRES